LTTPDLGGQPAHAHVLVVDDEFLIRWSLRERLVGDGFRVVEAGDAATARAVFRAQRFDVVLLDLRLPDSDGLDLLRELAAEARSRIIVITAHGNAELAEAAVRAGAWGFLHKPFDVEHMVELVASAAIGPAPGGGG
jgi:two-component system response regulator PilR (NtrC family)